MAWLSCRPPRPGDGCGSIGGSSPHVNLAGLPAGRSRRRLRTHPVDAVPADRRHRCRRAPHAVEAYVSRRANPFSDALAVRAFRTIGRHLRRACADGKARGTRGDPGRHRLLQLQRGAHGPSNAMLFPAVTASSVPAAESRYADCARALGAGNRR
ncbi:hypothetical protein [Streptomyces sp. 3213.3]|uniref:hypothetical protein n=1 Tax=Streptomyces sp. 3213.3 TaxID=1855348 RepID=UPI003FA68F9A